MLNVVINYNINCFDFNMPFTASNTDLQTVIRTDCVWLHLLRRRQICISYQYCGNGIFYLCRSPYRKPYVEYKSTEDEIANHEHHHLRFLKLNHIFNIYYRDESD